MSFVDENGPVIFANGFTSDDCKELDSCDDESVCSEVSTVFSVSRGEGLCVSLESVFVMY